MRKASSIPAAFPPIFPWPIFEDPELLLQPCGVTPDGRHLLLGGLLGDREGNLWRIDLTNDGSPILIIDQPRAQNQGSVSPDGRWIAYSSDESGLFEIFVEPFLPSAMAPQDSPGASFSCPT